MGEWKPGDVAMVNNGYDARPGIMIGRDPAARCWHSAEDDGDMRCVDHDRAALRRLVVIDPEDTGAIRRVADALIAEMCRADPEWDDARNFEVRAHLRAALCEFADPKPPKPPKPEEPTGLGAVVEDAAGELFVADFIDDDGEVRWYGPRTTRAADVYHHTVWSRIDAVRVLSEGVPS